ncbi:FliH/SctL family protein [Thalassospira sp. GO-4]|jgi:flagellar assembly protein FliH|uniref:FliH/SctL family protein n=1 Tax=Thalassospira sp. GO-4 TaxID=2946605 RepID=UPI0020240F12|nr:FliH/SctL family protein [Thalassospira sp. GO-4]URK19651.1 FliH/SctL family protein [Thalassospira sp. GO-4]
MTAIEKFTFALSFDDADNVIRSAGDDDEHYELGKKKKKKKDDTPPPPPAVYTEEQAAQMVAEAEQKGHEQGYAEGHAKGLEQGYQEVMASVEKAIGDVESVIAEKLGQIDEQQKRANAKINEDAIHVALGVIRKLAPAWSKQYQLVEIEDIIRQCLANLFDAPKVMIKVNPGLETQLVEVAHRIAESRGFSGKVVVVGEPDVAVGDCMVSWGDGTAVRDSARVWSEINGIIENALSLHASEHDLPESDMGDPEIQATPAPEKPASQNAQSAPDQASTPTPAQTSAQTPATAAPEQAATAQPTPATAQPTPPAPASQPSQPAATAPAPQPAPQSANPGQPANPGAQATQSNSAPASPQTGPAAQQAGPHNGPAATPAQTTVQTPAQPAPPQVSGNAKPDMAAANAGPAQNSATGQNTAPKEGDGTDARNVQTSTDNAMPKPDNALENPADQAKAPAPGTQPASGSAGETKNNEGQPTTGPQGTGDTTAMQSGPQAAPQVSQGQNQPPRNAATEPAATPTDAEKQAAVKQPTKDAGDENG